METIEDKNSYHFMDAERYVVGWLRGSSTKSPVRRAKVKGR
jgi:hypothetical protein